MMTPIKSPDLTSVGLDAGPLTDAKIRAYTLEGLYGIDRLRAEIHNDWQSPHIRDNIRKGMYGPLAQAEQTEWDKLHPTQRRARRKAGSTTIEELLAGFS